MSVGFDPVVYDTASEYHFRIRFRIKEDNPWACAGHAVAWEQVELSNDLPVAVVRRIPKGTPRISCQGNQIVLSSEATRIVLDSGSGQLLSFVHDDGELLAGPARLSFWRPLTNNDRGFDIQIARHPHELPNRGYWIAHFDYGQMGVGGTNSWGEKPLQKYRLSADRAYQYSLRFEPGILIR